jgi:hypothetical protein
MEKTKGQTRSTSYINGTLWGIFLTLCAVAAFVLMVVATGGRIVITW